MTQEQHIRFTLTSDLSALQIHGITGQAIENCEIPTGTPVEILSQHHGTHLWDGTACLRTSLLWDGYLYETESLPQFPEEA